jgi:hypothetical protein
MVMVLAACDCSGTSNGKGAVAVYAGDGNSCLGCSDEEVTDDCLPDGGSARQAGCWLAAKLPKQQIFG